MSDVLLHSLVFMFGTFISAVAQVLLKKSAMRSYDSMLAEYLNPFVIAGYVIFFVATFCTMLAYRVVPLSLGPILESTSYVYVTIFGVAFFKEEVSPRKLFALALIVAGILVYSQGV